MTPESQRIIRELLTQALTDNDGVELNMSNYHHDDVHGLNNAYVALFQTIEQALLELDKVEDCGCGMMAVNLSDHICNHPKDWQAIAKDWQKIVENQKETLRFAEIVLEGHEVENRRLRSELNEELSSGEPFDLEDPLDYETLRDFYIARCGMTPPNTPAKEGI